MSKIIIILGVILLTAEVVRAYQPGIERAAHAIADDVRQGLLEDGIGDGVGLAVAK